MVLGPYLIYQISALKLIVRNLFYLSHFGQKFKQNAVEYYDLTRCANIILLDVDNSLLRIHLGVEFHKDLYLAFFNL